VSEPLAGRMWRALGVLGVLWASGVGCSSGTRWRYGGGLSDSGAPHFDAGVEAIETGPRPLDGGGSIQSLALPTNDLVFDSKRGVLYATTYASADAGNSVVTIDPASATVTAALPVGDVPSVLAISDDGSALYVGVGTPTADTVRRIDLASMTLGPAVSLGSNAISQLSAGQIAAVPGSSTQYLVSLRQPGFQPDYAGMALYDGGTRLAYLDSFYGSGDSIAFSSPSIVFGCSNYQAPSDLIKYGVSSAAITPGTDVMGLITDGQRTRIVFNGGWIFASDGKVVSAATMALVGAYSDSTAQLSTDAAPLPDADGANVWFSGYVNGVALLDFDRTTFQLRRSISLAPAMDSDLYNPSALVQWSPTGLAFRSFSKVYVLTVPK